MADSVRLQIGALECSVLCDGTSALAEADITQMFPSDGGGLVEALRCLGAPLYISRNCLLVRTGGKVVLVDAGMGRLDPDDPGLLVDALGKIAIEPDAIDTVVITHYHRDHIGGLLDGEGKAVFRNARLVVPRREHEHVMREELLQQLNLQSAGMLRRTFAVYGNRLDGVDETMEIAPGIRYVPLPGHTAGHSGVMVESDGARLLHVVDAIHLPIQINRPYAGPRFDADPEAAAATRRSVLERVADDQVVMLAFHFPFPGVGRLVRTGEQLRWEPAAAPA